MFNGEGDFVQNSNINLANDELKITNNTDVNNYLIFNEESLFVTYNSGKTWWVLFVFDGELEFKECCYDKIKNEYIIIED